MSFIEAYEKVRKLLEPLRKNSGNEEFIACMDEILAYAMDYHVADVEDSSKRFFQGYNTGIELASERAQKFIKDNLILIKNGENYGTHLAIPSTDIKYIMHLIDNSVKGERDHDK